MKTTNSIRANLLLGASILAFAQGPSRSAETGGTQLEEVIITAEKKTENLQQAPVAVTALSAEALAQAGATGFSDLSGLAPGLIVNNNVGILKTISIRGLGNQAPEGTGTSSVATHVDGVYLFSPHGLNSDFLDLDHIEVQAGPQGTVFGQSSTGGAVNIISKVPTLDRVQGNADLSYGSYNLVRFNTAANIPITDTLAIRAAISQNSHDGFGQAVNISGKPGYGLDTDNSVTARLSVLWQPTADFSVLARSYYYNLDTNGEEEKNILDPIANPRRTSYDFAPTLFNNTQIDSVTAKWSLGPAEITSITSWQWVERNAPVDNDGLNYALARIYYPNPPFGHDLVPAQGGTERSIMQEVNIASTPGDGPFSWLVGGFWHDYLQHGNFLEYQVSDPTIPILPTFNAKVLGNIGNGFEALTHNTRTQYSTFAQGEYRFTDWLSVTGGARYNFDDTVGANLVYFSTTTVPLEEASHALTGKASVNLKLSQDHFLYAAWSNGYKPGGTNIVATSYGLLVPPTFEPEKNSAFEVGSKNEFLDKRVRANISGFYYDYSNLQISAQDPIPFTSGTVGIPKSKIYGIEGEFNALLPYGLKFDMNGSLEYSRIDSNFPALDPTTANTITILQTQKGIGLFDPRTIGARAAGATNIQGNPVPNVPRFSSYAALSDTLDFGEKGVVTTKVSVNFHDKYHTSVFANPAVDVLKSSAIFNLNVHYDPVSSPWAAELIVLNLFNRDAVSSKDTDAFGVGTTWVQYVPPLQVIGKLSYKF